MIDLGEITLAAEKPYNPDEERAAFIARMKAEGYDVVVPKANELQIDIDSEDAYTVFLDAVGMFIANGAVSHLHYDEHPSRSGLPCRHITVRLPFELDTWQRIALQAAFGSDYKRELLSCVRALRRDEYPTLFVEAPRA